MRKEGSRRFSVSPGTWAITSIAALERGAPDLGGEQVVDLEDAGGVVHLDLDLDGALVAGLDADLVDRRGGEGVDPELAALDRDARAALRHVERVGDAHHARLDRVRLAAAAVADDRVQRSPRSRPCAPARRRRRRAASRGGRRPGRGCRPRGRRGGSTCRRRAAARRRPRPPPRRAASCRWSVTIAGSIPPLASRRSSRSEMLRTTCTWTHEWSDIPSRCEVTCAMYHQARTRSSALTASRNRSSLRLPRVGAWTSAAATASAGARRCASGPAAPSGRSGALPLRRSSACPPLRGSWQRARSVSAGRPESRYLRSFRPRRALLSTRSDFVGIAMPNCRHTGLSVPECSCRPCLEAQLAQHQPSLLAPTAVRRRPGGARRPLPRSRRASSPRRRRGPHGSRSGLGRRLGAAAQGSGARRGHQARCRSPRRRRGPGRGRPGRSAPRPPAPGSSARRRCRSRSGATPRARTSRGSPS